jgi:hypothetical protein
MPYSADDIRTRYPHATEDEVKRVVKILNTPAATLRDIWAGEDQRGDTALEVDAHGLTEPMRELNRFAEENALPLPFSLRRDRR